MADLIWERHVQQRHAFYVEHVSSREEILRNGWLDFRIGWLYSDGPEL